MAIAASAGVTVTEMDYSLFTRKTLALTGIDLRSYKPEQMRRRLAGLAAREGARSLGEYARLIERDARRLQDLKDFLTINVTEFFRDYERFVTLRGVLATHPKRSGLRVWSAGCSTGAEPYSIAIMLDELGLRGKAKILATDVDAGALARARQGRNYRESEMRNVSAERRRRYFEREGDTYAVVERIRSTPAFRQHNLLSQTPPEEDFDLILCRNVVIYFTDEAKDAVFARLAGALAPGGMLMVGGTEMLSNASALGLQTKAISFYAKRTPSKLEAGRYVAS
ncbi:MAG: CheR family methyltransferase [Chloroflexota bacterium]